MTKIFVDNDDDLRTEPGPANSWQFSGQRFLGHKSQVIALVRLAWGDMQRRIAGAPSWINDRYDVFANAPDNVPIGPNREGLSLMMRARLIERFKLSAHLETRDATIFALVMARADRRPGPRLRPPMPDCPLSTGTSARGGPACGPGTGSGVIKFGNLPMSSLALFLSRLPIVGRRVVDETGLEGGYSIDLEYLPEQLTATPQASPDLSQSVARHQESSRRSRSSSG
ncbi:MAG: TIGR03435 family protein [Acidobacteria bacterium]|nr:TIGR03435 family protein [Acidobacteriota bacterium]